MPNMARAEGANKTMVFFSAEGDFFFGAFCEVNGLFREVVVEKIDFLHKF